MASVLSASQILLGCGRGWVRGRLGDSDTLLALPQLPQARQRGCRSESRSRSLQGRELGKEMEEEVPPLLGAG